MKTPKTIRDIEQIDIQIKGQKDRTDVYRLRAAVIFLDIEGYTQIIYQCGDDQKKMNDFCTLMTEFWQKMELQGLDNSIRLINNAGDGFLALSDDPKRKRTNASIFSASLIKEFESFFEEFPKNIGYRFKPRIRIGLHFGDIYIISRRLTESYFEYIFIGDALNVAARIASSNTARHHKIACSDKFYNRLLSDEKVKYKKADTFYDLNKYPEPIIIYGYQGESNSLNKK